MFFSLSRLLWLLVIDILLWLSEGAVDVILTFADDLAKVIAAQFVDTVCVNCVDDPQLVLPTDGES